MRARDLGAVLAALALAGCGSGSPVNPPMHDADIPDGPAAPQPPVLGAQLDRAGRPGIATLLLDALGPAGTAHTAIVDNYNHATDPAMWESTTLSTNVSILNEFEKNLALFDAFDGTCGNAMRYSGPPKATSYEVASRMLADDEIHVDTSGASCGIYLAL